MFSVVSVVPVSVNNSLKFCFGWLFLYHNVVSEISVNIEWELGLLKDLLNFDTFDLSKVYFFNNLVQGAFNEDLRDCVLL